MSITVVATEQINQELTRTFVRGEIASLQWVSTCKSLSQAERRHIIDRLKKLEAFVRDEIPAEHDPTVPRWVPDFQEGEK